MDKVYTQLGASKIAKEERQKEDYYSTDPIVVNHLLEREPWLNNPNLKFLEPCAGEGAIADRFKELTNIQMDLYDIVKRREDIKEADYFKIDLSNQYDVIFTNPPYLKDTSNTTTGLADFILKALKEVKVGGSVIMFLKTLHLETKVRYEKIYKNFPPSKIYIYSDRVSCFKEGKKYGGGAISFSLFLWTNKKEDGSFDKDTRIDWIRYK